MLSFADFKEVQVQATIFTPGLNFQNGSALGLFLAKWPEHFPIIVFASDVFAAPQEMPRLILQSADSRYKLQAGPARLDVIWVAPEPHDRIEMPTFFKLCCEIFDEYFAHFRGTVGRAGGIITRVASDPHPAETISGHFLKNAWLQENRATAGLADVEVNLAVQHVLGDQIHVNDWLKCKSGVVARPGPLRL